MIKHHPGLLAALISVGLYGHDAAADDLYSQCMLGVPTYNRPFTAGDTAELPVTIQADAVSGHYPTEVMYQGRVDAMQGNSRLQSDVLQLLQQQQADKSVRRSVQATGHVLYDDHQIKLTGTQAWSNLDSKDTNVWDSSYLLVGRQGRGTAREIKLRDNNRYTILEQGSFTTCLPGDNSWSVVGSRIIEDHDEQVAEIWNARFNVGAVPIFYSPYLQLPIGNRRRSGFLIPDVRYGSNDGYEFALPYYLNLAPQADATITPHYISRRGIKWQNEFRYLTGVGGGLFAVDYLPHDAQYQRSKAQRNINAESNDRRWLLFWQHAGVYDEHWRFSANYTKVSDSYYFNDLDSQFYSSTDGYATQNLNVAYVDNNWSAKLSSIDFQLFDTLSSNTYHAMPQLDVNLVQNDLGPFDGQLYAQAVNFQNASARYPRATRLHIEPALRLPLSSSWASINTEASLLATHYQQSNLDYYNQKINEQPDQPLRGTFNRLLPQLKVDSQLIFERDMVWLPNYTQTLEPKAQYLYRPYRDQSAVVAFDSTLLQSDYTGLFRARAYSGLDRINSANDLATGITSRIYGADLVERFNLSLGQIYSFTPSRTGLNTISKETDTGSLIWAGDTFLRLTPQWVVRGGMQYDTRLNNVAQGNAVVEYRRDSESMLQLNYRYSSAEYVATALQSNVMHNSVYNSGISQAGILGSWPLARSWSLIGAHYYSTRNNRLADQYMGVQYSTCCYAIRLGYERKINGWQNNQSQYDNKVSFNIQLRGLTPDYSLGTGQMLRAGIIPYQPLQ